MEGTRGLGGWWICCMCKHHMNPALAPNECSMCGKHYKCATCFVYPVTQGHRASPTPARPSSALLSTGHTELVDAKPNHHRDSVGSEVTSDAPARSAMSSNRKERSEDGVSDRSPILPGHSVSSAVGESTTYSTTVQTSQGSHQPNLTRGYEDISNVQGNKSTAHLTGFDTETSLQLAIHFARELFENLLRLPVNLNLAPSMTDILESFASILDQSARASIEIRAVAFVRQQRDTIVEFLYEKFLAGRPGWPPRMLSDVDVIDLKDRPNKYDALRDENLIQIDELADILPALLFLTRGPEFSWLIRQIRVACSLMSTGDSFTRVRRDIIAAVNGSASAHFSRIKRAWFQVEWDAVTFFQEQYPAIDRIHLAEVLCLVGSGSTIEAVTCASYVAVTWPAVGPELVKALDSAFVAIIQLGRKTYPVNVMPELKIDVETKQNSILVKVDASNTPPLVEVGEILAWLSAACRSSAQHDRITSTVPYVYSSVGDDPIVLKCSELDRDPTLPTNSEINSHCWEAIFKNPVICHGYPIGLRRNDEKGLRIPVDIMTTLACATTAVMYGRILILKGLCSMFVPVLKLGSSIIWHYLVNEDLSWLSHNASESLPDLVRDLKFADLHSCSHYVGWSRKVHEVIGRPGLAYHEIRDAKLREVGPGCVWEDVTIGFSKIIELSSRFARGNKDSRIYPTHGGTYPRTIDIACGMTVVFYDAVERRAWLTDGADALLLLVRTALSSVYARGAGNRSQKIVDQFDLAVSGLSPHAPAADILLCDSVRNIPLYGDKDHPRDLWYLEKLVEEKWELLDEMRSHQTRLRNQGGKDVSLRWPLPRVEGFEFIDMVSCSGPLRPKYAELNMSATWLELPSKLGAVNIIGASLGHLFRPIIDECKKAIEVPSGCDVLFVPNRLLDPKTSNRRGELYSDHVELARDLFWDEPYKSFGSIPCPCTHSNGHGTCGKVVSTLRNDRPKKLKDQRKAGWYDVFEEFPRGAIIIGSEAAARKAEGRPADSSLQLSSQVSTDSGYHSGHHGQGATDSNGNNPLAIRLRKRTASSIVSNYGSRIRCALRGQKPKTDP